MTAIIRHEGIEYKSVIMHKPIESGKHYVLIQQNGRRFCTTDTWNGHGWVLGKIVIGFSSRLDERYQ